MVNPIPFDCPKINGKIGPIFPNRGDSPNHEKFQHFPFFLDESVPYLYVYLDDKTVLKIFVSICQLDLVFYKLITENLYLDKSDN